MSGQYPEPPEDEGAVSGPEHYLTANYYAEKAVAVMGVGDVAAASAFAAIGQVHATLAAAAAATLHPDAAEYDQFRAWREVTGQAGR